MSSLIQLRFTKLNNTPPNVEAYDSQVIVLLDGPAGVHLDMEGSGNAVNILHSMTGMNFVTCQQDMFSKTWDAFIRHPGIGQAVKVRVNKLPVYGCILGNVEDAGDTNPDEPETDLLDAFAGSEGVYFQGSDSSYFIGKTA